MRTVISARVVVAAAAAVLLAVTGSGTAQADPPAADSSYVVGIESVSDTLSRMVVHSAAMNQDIVVQVLTPADSTGPRPSLYLLSGLGEEDPSNSMWLRKTNVEAFFRDKNVNVVLPLAGNGSFYTDWQREDPKLGRYQWDTFLTAELPPLVDESFDGNGDDAVAGISMGAQSAMMLASQHPGRYRAVASYSGCYASASPLGQLEMRGIVAAFGGNADNMFGPPTDPDWAAHDPLLNAENLRGTTVYVSTGTGLPGPHETPDAPNLVDRVVVGGLIEAGSNWCTHQLDDRLRQLAIPATFDYTPTGTHAWPYWVDQLPLSWPVIGGALGVA